MGANVTRFEIEGECRNKSTALNCSIGWTETSNGSRITHLGQYEPGEFEADGDLAGLGTLLSFLIPTGVSLVIGLIMLCGMSVHGKRNPQNKSIVRTFVPSPHGNPRRRRRPKHQHIGQPPPPPPQLQQNERVYNILEAILTATSDYQSVFGAALCIYFAVIGKCSVSMYHFKMGLDLIILICANSLLVIVFTRHFWRTPFSSLGRLIACGLLLYYSGQILWLMQQRNKTYGVVEWMPPSDRNNSLILLQAACFLDPNPLSDLVKLGQEQLLNEVVGQIEKKKGLLPEYILWYILLGCFILAVLFRIINLCYRKKADNDLDTTNTKRGTGWRRIRVFVCVLILILCTAIYGYQTYHLVGLRQWVFDSAWLKNDEYLGNEEVAVSSFGQVAALCALIGFVLMGMDQVEWRSKP